MRWQTDDGSDIPPEEFIPIAEASGLITKIGQWTFRAISRDLSVMQDLVPDLYIAVNVSARQLEERTALSGLMEVLETAKVSADILIKPSAMATLTVLSLAVTSTILALPCSSKWVNAILVFSGFTLFCHFQVRNKVTRPVAGI